MSARSSMGVSSMVALGTLAQGVVAEFLCFWVYRLDFLDQRLNQLHVAR